MKARIYANTVENIWSIHQKISPGDFAATSAGSIGGMPNETLLYEKPPTGLYVRAVAALSPVMISDGNTVAMAAI